MFLQAKCVKCSGVRFFFFIALKFRLEHLIPETGYKETLFKNTCHLLNEVDLKSENDTQRASSDLINSLTK